MKKSTDERLEELFKNVFDDMPAHQKLFERLNESINKRN